MLPWSGHHSGVFGRQGATLQVDEESGAVFIARVFHGGAADRSGNVGCFGFGLIKPGVLHR